MDRNLNHVVTESARNLLSISPVFEPFVPQSHQNILHSLRLLQDLGKVTSESFKSKEKIPAVHTSPPKTTPTVQKKEHLDVLTDQHLIEALLDLRKSNTFSEHRLRNFSSIIRCK